MMYIPCEFYDVVIASIETTLDVLAIVARIVVTVKRIGYLHTLRGESHVTPKRMRELRRVKPHCKYRYAIYPVCCILLSSRNI